MHHFQNNGHAVFFENLEPRQLLSAGQLDGTFGVNGVFNLPETSVPRAFAIGNNGKMFLAEDGQLRRLRVGGGIDRTYGNNGSVFLPFTINVVAVQNDGRVLVAGITTNDPDDAANNFQLEVARLTISGKLDRTFGRNGRFALPPNTGSEALCIALRGGKIVVGGRTNGEDSVIVVLNLDGTANTDFSQDGVLIFGTNEVVENLSVAKNGSITAMLSQTTSGFRTARITSTGEFDNSYSGDGISALVKLTEQGYFANGDGSLIVSAYDEVRNVAVLVRMTSRGKLDRSFGNLGAQDIPHQGFLGALPIQSSNGTRYLYGKVGTSASSDAQHIFIARLTVDNHLDTSFGNQGFLTVGTDFDDDAFGAAFVPQGDKLVMAVGAYSARGFQGFSSELIRIIV